MAMYDVGDIVTLSATFSADASSVSVSVRKPDGTIDGNLTAADSGDHKTWTLDYAPDKPGPYWYRFAGVGAVAAQEGTFTVRATRAAATSPVQLWVISRDEALNALSLDSAAKVNTDAVDVLIGGVSRLLDRECGPVVVRDQVDELDGGKPNLLLRRRPVYEVTSVVEWYFNVSHTLTQETPGNSTTLQYLLDDPRLGQLWRRESSFDTYFAPGRRNVVVTYKAGRFETTADVDEQFKQAAVLTFANIWRREFGMGSGAAAALAGVTYALPYAALQMLAGELLMDVGAA